MFQLFGSLKTLVKPQSCHIDNHIFRLHYRVTTTLLVAFSLMVTAHQYFGDPIDCVTKRDIPATLLDTYCWLHSTYSVEGAWQKEVGVDVPYPGVDNSIQAEQSDSKRVYHGYYQWVCFALFAQAIAFYLPHYLWKVCEGGLLKNLILGLDKPILKPTAAKEENLVLLAEFLTRSRGALHQKLYLCYVICELLNLMNVLTQMMLMDRFLGGEFFNYGWEVLTFRQESPWPLQYSPMVRLFPRVTKCSYYMFGPTATIEHFDTMCLLPVNVLSEKVYLFLWFWFYLLTVLSSLVLLYRLLTTLSPSVRRFVLYLNCRTLKMKRIAAVLNTAPTANLGDWLLLRLLAKNLHTLNFHDLMLQLEGRLTKQVASKKEMNSLHHSD